MTPDTPTPARWRPASAWPHWCPHAQVANIDQPHSLVRVWDPTVRNWFWFADKDDLPGATTAREVRAAYSRVRSVPAPDSFRYSWFRGLTDTAPKAVERTLADLGPRLTRHARGAKDELPLWSPARFNGRRSKSSVIEVCMIVLDYDDGTTIESAVGTWGAYAHVVYTTPSHTPELPKFRVVLPLAEPVPADRWGAVWRWAEERSGRQVDPKCKDASRIYYGHGGPDPRVARAFYKLDDRPLLWMDLERLPREAPAPKWTPLPPPPPKPVTADEAAAQAIRLLATCPDTRRRAGSLAGGSISDTRVTRVTCPQCGRPSVWWPIVPERVRSAMCNHRKTCGWIGSIYEVIQ